jgi:predicted DNA-binding transcriptional regulator YafY
MRDGIEIDITYQSMRVPDPTRQWIAPHSLAFDGARWHARAWCHGSSQFRDFVLTRFQQIHGSRPSALNPQDDVEWQTFFVVEIEPNTNLTTSQRDSVIDDFGMMDGRLSKTIRRALVPYFARHLRIDEVQTAQSIVWANRSQFEEMKHDK